MVYKDAGGSLVVLCVDIGLNLTFWIDEDPIISMFAPFSLQRVTIWVSVF